MARETQRNVVGIAAQVALMLAMVVLLVPFLTGDRAHLSYPEPGPAAGREAPIAEEADVFRTDPGDLAVAPASTATRTGGQRTLATLRALRAYPGAPPHIPHALTEDEFRFTRCSACHERGGWAPRFAAYAPVTPHPEYTNCLQCHAVEQTTSDLVPTDWRPAVWPAVGQRAMEGAPPWIPHDLQLRGNCLTCHGGPAAALEIRTKHPERANCRQCHVLTGSGDAQDGFTRPVAGVGSGQGDRR